MPRHLTPSQAAEQVRARDRVAFPLGPGQPPAFLRALGERDDFEELHVFTGLLSDLFPLFARKGVQLLSGFYGPAERMLAQAGHDVRFLPADFRRFAPVLERLRPRVMATAVAERDPNGPLSLSLHAGATVQALRACGRDPDRLLIAEINPHLPFTHGLPPEHTHSLERDEVDILIRAESKLLELPGEQPNAVQRSIAGHARAFIPRTATLQTGIGGIAGAIVSALAAERGGEYGIHSEMFTDALMALHESGQVRNQKGAFDGRSIATFAAGSRHLYDWLDDNREVAFLPVDVVNDPARIARNRNMVSINGALAIDLFGQVAADTLAGRQHSGIGGHEDFAAAAGLQSDDRSLTCLPSTSEVDGKPVSRITPLIGPDMRVTTPRHQLDVVVTEHGAADLRALDVDARAHALIGIAHPDFRDELLDHWQRLHARRL
jgi:acyl-CoA hydrolase